MGENGTSAIQETQIGSKITNSELLGENPNYDVFCKDCNTKGGGVMLITKNFGGSPCRYRLLEE